MTFSICFTFAHNTLRTRGVASHRTARDAGATKVQTRGRKETQSCKFEYAEYALRTARRTLAPHTLTFRRQTTPLSRPTIN